MKKKEMKLLVLTMSVTMVASMIPLVAFADSSASTEPVKTQSNQQKASAEQAKVKTFAEAFPDEYFRRVIIDSLGRERDLDRLAGVKDSLIINVDENTKITPDIVKQLKKVKVLDVDLMVILRQTPNPTNLKSLAEYFTGVEYLRTYLYSNYPNWGLYKDMLSKMKNLKYLEIEGNNADDYDIDNAPARNYDFPYLANLETLRFYDLDTDKVDTSKLTNLKTFDIRVYNTEKENMRNIDLSKNNKLENLEVMGDIDNITLGNQKLKKLDIYTTTLMCANIQGNLAPNASVNISKNRREIVIPDKKAGIDIRNIPGFKAENVVKGSVANGTFKNGKFYIKDTSRNLTYKYKCGDSVIGEFSILPLVFKPIEIKRGQTTVDPKYVANCFLNKDIFLQFGDGIRQYDLSKFRVEVMNKIPKNPKATDKKILYIDGIYDFYDNHEYGGYDGFPMKVPYVLVDGNPQGAGGGAGGSAVTPNSQDVSGAPSVTGKWHKNSNGTWSYIGKDNKLVTNAMVEINGKTYYFDQKGIMKTGWLKKDDKWYYFNQKGNGTEGAMASQTWKKINNKWYFFYKNGTMAANEFVGDYYVNKNGAWTTDRWVKSANGKWWYSYKEGTYPKAEIATVKGHKYYFDESGYMKTGWLKFSNDWYYFNQKGNGIEGAMAEKQWKKVSGKWYYFNEDGHMVSNTWKKVNGSWYYFYKSGAMAANTVVNGYKVNGSGAWIR